MNHTYCRSSSLRKRLFHKGYGLTEKKGRYRRAASKLLTLLLLLTAVFLFTACASDQDKNGNSASSAPSYSAENTENGETENTGAYKAASLTDFKTAASAYGTVSDLTSQLTYESAVVTNNDKFNIIYMKTPSAEEAKRIIFEESAADSSASPYITTLRSGTNFDYYEENVPADTSAGTEPFYGYYLRVDGMLLLITGAPEDKTAVKDTAGKLFEMLGYSAE